MTTPTQYKPLALTQVCEIREEVELFYQSTPLGRFPALSIALVVDRYKAAGYDPADVRQAAEEALVNLRAPS